LKYYNITKFPKWQQRVIKEASEIAENFITKKYNIDNDIFELVELRISNTCRFAKYNTGYGKIRLNGKLNFVNLYDKKSIGSYKKIISSIGYKVSYICQLIHELTHFVQDLEDRCFSEVETTQNEIEYLESIGYKIKL